LSRKSSKAEVLDQYLTVLNKEKAKLAQKEESQMDSDSSELDSKSDTSIVVIEQVTTPPKKRKMEDYLHTKQFSRTMKRLMRKLHTSRKYMSVMKLSPVLCLKIDMNPWAIA